MAATNIYTLATLETMKLNNDDYLANKAMYRELQKIKLLVLGQNNLYGSANPVTYTYTSISGNDYFGTLMQQLQAMFPGCFIYYTRRSSSQVLTYKSIKYELNLITPSYTASSVSITNVLFISQTELSIPSSILDGRLVFSYTKTGISQSVALENIPLNFASGVFDKVNINAIITENSVTVTVNTKYYSTLETNSDFGLTFKNKSFFENGNGVTNINITILNNIPLSKTGSQFYGLYYISIYTGQKPIILPETSLLNCFSQCRNFNSDISGWDTFNVTDMSYMFANALAFNSNISGWDTTNVTNMSYMFANALAFNSNISGWNTTNVTDMSYMFADAEKFDSNIGNWITTNVKNMSFMFFNAFEFNQPIGNWNTSNVENMSGMFANDPDEETISKFNQDIGNWNTLKVTNMSYMFNATFSGGVSFNNGDVSGGTTKKMNWTFNNLINFSDWHLNSALTQANAPNVLQTDPW